MNTATTRNALLPALVFAALATAIVSSLGMLLVPSIAAQFNVDVATAQWMLTVNLLAGAVATPILGRLSDGPHKKRLLLLSLGIMFIGSVLAAAAQNFELFLIGRALQGLSYGIVPITISIARRYVEQGKIQPAISTLSVTVASGIGIGYPLTGIIAGLFDYSFAFWFGAAFVLATIIVVWKVVPAGPDSQAESRPFDYLGTLLLTLGLGSLLLAISEGPKWGWGSMPILALLIFASIILAVWVLVENKLEHPLINLRTLKQGEVLLANISAIALGAALYIGMSVSSLVAQADESTGYGLALPVFWAGFVIFPLSVGSFAANRIVRTLAKKVGIQIMLPIGAIIMSLAGTLLWLLHSELWEILISMLVFGLGMGASYAAMPALIARSVAVKELGSSVSFNQVLRTVGSSFGTAISSAILATHAGLNGEATPSGINMTFMLGAVLCIALGAALLVNSAIRTSRTTYSAPLRVD
ncbi:MFS transporter [Glutamicibacter halophytocola]|uniref:MFS transporter n=1 Tax=Glutamicibacter halophytocola TaxID=1933880 RepID=UPI0006D49CC1|nr:MFS transporter [Glutamicibacter halophytocola]ALG30434.1 MFS transporter [Glutamicibacter halophytocola]